MTGYNSSKPTPNVKGSWYFINHEWCPVCGKDSTERTRMPPPRPADWKDRHESEEHYDYCLEWESLHDY